MQMNNLIRLLKLTLVSVVAVVVLIGCASESKSGKAAPSIWCKSGGDQERLHHL